MVQGRSETLFERFKTGPRWLANLFEFETWKCRRNSVKDVPSLDRCWTSRLCNFNRILVQSTFWDPWQCFWTITNGVERGEVVCILCVNYPSIWRVFGRFPCFPSVTSPRDRPKRLWNVIWGCTNLYWVSGGCPSQIGLTVAVQVDWNRQIAKKLVWPCLVELLMDSWIVWLETGRSLCFKRTMATDNCPLDVDAVWIVPNA